MPFDPKLGLLIGTNKGLDIFKDGKISPFVKDEKYPSPSIAVLTIYQGAVFAALEGEGVFRCVEGKFIPIEDSVTPARSVCSFYVDEEKHLWIGTRGEGLRVFDGKNFAILTMKDGLYDDEIFELVPDDRQRLWMASSKGVFVVEKIDLNRLADGRLKK